MRNICIRIEISHFYKKKKKRVKFGARGITNIGIIGIRDVITEHKTFEELNCFKYRSKGLNCNIAQVYGLSIPTIFSVVLGCFHVQRF